MILPLYVGLEPGLWFTTVTQNGPSVVAFPKSLYNQSSVSIHIEASTTTDTKIEISWVFRLTECGNEYENANESTFRFLFDNPERNEQEGSHFVDAMVFPNRQDNKEKSETSNLSVERINNKLKSPLAKIHTASHPNIFLLKAGEPQVISLPHQGGFVITEETSLPESTVSPTSTNKAVSKTDTKAESKTDTKTAPTADTKTNRKEEEDSANENADTESADTENLDKANRKKISKASRKRREAVKSGKPTEKPSQVTSTVTFLSTASLAHVDDPYKDNKDLFEVLETTIDGIYLLLVEIKCASSDPKCSFTATVRVEMQHMPSGSHLSAIEWPMLPFFMIMCGIYVILALLWLVALAIYWRDIIRLQYWIGGLILLGLIEKALFLAEYEHLNVTGESVWEGTIFLAEAVNALKRTLARVMIVIVAVGFGYIKPRLEPTLVRKIAMISGVFFMCALIEGVLRQSRNRADVEALDMAANVPVAFIDSILVLWILSSLVSTMRALRIRNNLAKLALYRQFTMVLVFSVFASVGFMVWSLLHFRWTFCVTEWKQIWIEEAFWHILFSILLATIMFLWRPSQNSIRFETASKFLLDEEEGEEEDEIAMKNLAEEMKVRKSSTENGEKKPVKKANEQKQDEDLKWVEENIPISAETVLPSLLDSDEERQQAQYERSKLE